MAQVFGAIQFNIGAGLTGGFFSAFGAAETRIQKLGSAVADLQGKQAAIGAFQKQVQDTKAAAAAWSQAQGRLRELKGELATAPTAAIAREYERTKAAVARLGDAYQQQSGKLGAMRSALQQAGVDTGRLAAEQQRLTGEMQKAAAAQDRIAARRVNAERRQALIGEAVLSAGAGLGFQHAVGEMRDQAADFEHGLARFQTVSGLAAERIAAVRVELRKTGEAVNQEAPALLAGVEFLTGKGLDVDKSVASIAAIGKTATATGASIEDLSKASFTLLDTMKLSPDDLPRALDMLAQAGKEGGFELKDMAKWLPELGAAASAAGLKGKEAAATLGSALQIMLKGSGDPDQAANNMKNLLAKMTAPETLKNFNKFGIDLEKEMKAATARGLNPLDHFLMLVQKATGGDAFRIGELFGDMQVLSAIKPMLEATDKGLENYREYQRIKAASLAAEGTVDADFATMMATNREATRGFGIAVDNLKESIGRALLPAATSLMQALTPWASAIGNLVEQHPGLTRAVVQLGSALLFARTAFLGLQILGTYGPMLTGIGGVIGPLGSAFTAVAGIMTTTVVPAFVAVGAAAFAAVGWWLIPIIGAVVLAIGGAAAMIYKYWEPITAFVSGVVDGFAGAFAEVGQAIGALMPDFQVMGQQWPILGQAFELGGQAISFVAGAVRDLWQWFGQLVEPVRLTQEEFGAFADSGAQLGHVIGTVLLAPFKLLIGAIETVKAGIGWITGAIDSVSGLGEAVTAGWKKAWGTPAKPSTQRDAAAAPSDGGRDMPNPNFARGPSVGATRRAANDDAAVIGATRGPANDNGRPAAAAPAPSAPSALAALPAMPAAPGSSPAPGGAAPAPAAAGPTQIVIQATFADMAQQIAREVERVLDRRDRDRAGARRAALYDG